MNSCTHEQLSPDACPSVLLVKCRPCNSAGTAVVLAASAVNITRQAPRQAGLCGPWFQGPVRTFRYKEPHGSKETTMMPPE